jgi:hypothetical protein
MMHISLAFFACAASFEPLLLERLLEMDISGSISEAAKGKRVSRQE